jgi:hypothetical protein
VRREDGVSEAGRGYPLAEDRIQAEIVRYVWAVDRAVSRSELTQALGVSRSKTSLEVGRLPEAGLRVEDGLAESEGGRRSSLLRIPRSAGLIAAVDLGATSVDVALSTLGSEPVGHSGELGGGVADIKHSLLAEIRSTVYRRSLPLATRNLPIVLSELEGVACITGASVLAAEGVLQTTRVS